MPSAALTVKYLARLMLAVIFIPLTGIVAAGPTLGQAQLASVRYLSPSPGAEFVPPGTTVALRLDGAINPTSLSASVLTALGSVSGRHSGQAILADDGSTVVYKLTAPFKPGEQVQVTISGGLVTTNGAIFSGASTQFGVGTGGARPDALTSALSDDMLVKNSAATSANVPAAANSVSVHPQDYVTFPHDFPNYTVTVPATGTAPGLLFMAPFRTDNAGHNFLFISDDSGEPVYWQAATLSAFDFKLQPDGSLTYYDGSDGLFHVDDHTYSQTRTIGAANGYVADIHDLQILTDTGHSLLLIYDSEITSTLEFGGFLTATVTGLVIQELDSNGLPVFQWDSWSHIPLSDTQVSLTTPTVDYVHGNAIERDYDGNLLLSSWHLSEITKINRQTGDIMWRLGGKANQFPSLALDPEGPFTFQHDIRRLPNGNLTIFDNHDIQGGFSRAVEYEIDEVNKVVTNTWEYRNNPDIFSLATGNNQRLPDGHRLIDWGLTYPNVTEVLTDGTKLFELTLDPGYITYRAFRFPWAAVPNWNPTLVFSETITPTLYYSWNGATDVASYNIYGAVGSLPNVLLGNQPRTGFENHTLLSNLPASYCAFRVQPLNHAGQPQPFSNIVYSRAYCPARYYFPIIFR